MHILVNCGAHTTVPLKKQTHSLQYRNVQCFETSAIVVRELIRTVYKATIVFERGKCAYTGVTGS